MTDFGPPYSPPPPPAPSPGTAEGRTGRRSMVLRHLFGAGFALLVTPIGLLVFDYGAGEYLRERIVNFDQEGAVDKILLMFLGAAILMAVALSARLSGLGPILAGLVWGLAPLVWFMADFASFADFSRDLPSTHFWFASPPLLFPLVAALLVGAGLAGRWRGRVIAAPSWQWST